MEKLISFATQTISLETLITSKTKTMTLLANSRLIIESIWTIFYTLLCM
jgi:hypothetical protein